MYHGTGNSLRGSVRLSNLYIYFESKNDNLFACFVLHSLPLKSSVAEESTSVSAAAAPPRRPGVEASSPTAAAARALRVRLSASAALKAAILAAAAPAAAPAPAPPPRAAAAAAAAAVHRQGPQRTGEAEGLRATGASKRGVPAVQLCKVGLHCPLRGGGGSRHRGGWGCGVLQVV